MGNFPVCVFLLDFLFKKPRRVFFYLFFPLHTQFSLWNFSISFRFVFFAYFSLQKPTTCVFSLVFSSLHPFFAMDPLDENRLYINQLHKKWHIQRNPPNMPLNQPISNIIYQNYAHTYHKYDIPKYNRHLTQTITPENSESSLCLFLPHSRLPMSHHAVSGLMP